MDHGPVVYVGVLLSPGSGRVFGWYAVPSSECGALGLGALVTGFSEA